MDIYINKTMKEGIGMEKLQMIGFMLLLIAGSMADSPDLRYPLAVFAVSAVMILIPGYFNGGLE